MRQQLRLRVLLPIAVLGLLGAGFGAYAFGQAPEPAATALPPTTTAAAPGPSPTGALQPKAWAKAANALCTDLYGTLDELAPPAEPTPKELAASVRAYGQETRSFAQSFRRLGWPRGEETAVLALRAELARTSRFFESFLAAFRARDFERLDGLADADVAARWDAEVLRLGARDCADAPELGSAAGEVEGRENEKMAPALALEWGLYFDRAVVVLFYTPRVGLDGTTVLEARSAALAAGAGFLAVNVRANKQVTELAAAYEVTEAPAVLVFVRGPELAARFGRFADRETIAQAVQNALR